jgi:hypothetical protein
MVWLERSAKVALFGIFCRFGYVCQLIVIHHVIVFKCSKDLGEFEIFLDWLNLELLVRIDSGNLWYFADSFVVRRRIFDIFTLFSAN